MLIQVDQAALLDGLNIVSRVVAVRSVNPVLAGVLLLAESGRLQITANDLEISISTEMICSIQEPGEVVIPARLLTEAVRRCPDQAITLNFLRERNAVQLVSGSMQMEILTLPAEEFPEQTAFAAEKTYTLPQQTLKEMVKQVYFCISKEELRPVLTGALWSFATDRLSLTALDGYRMACRWSSLANVQSEAKVVVPGKALRELMRLLSDSGDLVCSVGESAISFQFNGISLVSRLLEGRFPNTEQFLPASYQTRITLEADLLIAAAERAALVSKDGSEGSVKLVIADDQLSVTAQSMDIGKHYEQFGIEQSGDDLEIMFHIKSLTEFLRSAGSPTVTIEFNGSFGQSILRPTDQDNYLGLMMPLRLS